MQECGAVNQLRSEMAGYIAQKSSVGKLDPKSRELFGKAEKAWQDFVDKSASFYGDQNRGGTIRSQVETSYVAEKNRAHAKDLKKVSDYKPDEKPDFEKADHELNENYKKAIASAGDDEAKGLLKAAQRAWIAYRDAESAFYVAAFGGKFGEKKVENDIRARLTEARARDLRPRK
jgi:uncharacterized protein YecT (DUF1311 family)